MELPRRRHVVVPYRRPHVRCERVGLAAAAPGPGLPPALLPPPPPHLHHLQQHLGGGRAAPLPGAAAAVRRQRTGGPTEQQLRLHDSRYL